VFCHRDLHVADGSEVWVPRSDIFLVAEDQSKDVTVNRWSKCVLFRRRRSYTVLTNFVTVCIVLIDVNKSNLKKVPKSAEWWIASKFLSLFDSSCLQECTHAMRNLRSTVWVKSQSSFYSMYSVSQKPFLFCTVQCESKVIPLLYSTVWIKNNSNFVQYSVSKKFLFCTVQCE
jgi:hypothetical protein